MRRAPIPFLLALLLALAVVAPAAAVQDVTAARAEGVNRFDTAAVVAGLAHPEGTTRAVLATSVAATDALTATPLAGALDAALLLARPDDLPAETAQALVDLGVSEIILVGGFAAISQDVEAQLAAEYDVRRIAGQNEWDTAALVAQAIAEAGGVPRLAEGAAVFLANEERFADALASSPAAYAAGMPVLYTSGDTVRGQVAWFLETYEVDHVVLLGGEQVLSSDVEGSLQAGGWTTTRLAGPTRVETAAVVASWTAPRFGFDLSTAMLARGDDFADAVTAGQLGGTAGAPILLSATPTVLPTSARTWFVDNCPTMEVVQAVGGEAAISVPLFNDVVDAAQSCAGAPTPPPPPPPPAETGQQAFLVTPQQAVATEPGTSLEFQVLERYGEPFTGPVDIILFPCTGAEVLGSGPDAFSDADADGGADGFGSTETGFARIALVNDVDIDDATTVGGVGPTEDGTMTFTVYSAEEDCTIPVVIDGNGDGAFNVDADGRPIEPYGLGQVSFTAA